MKPVSDYIEKDLIDLLANDSEYAFQLLFDRYRDKVYRIAMMYVKSASVAEDIVQDVFLKIWFQRKNLQNVSCLESWIYTLTKNFTINSLKKIAHEWKARSGWKNEMAMVDDTTDHKVRGAEYQQLLHDAVKELPEQQQKVYRMGKEYGMSYEEIGKSLSISTFTVKTHMARALAAIRQHLQQYGNEYLFVFLIGKIIF
jgi:RNA polymerase sigma-70 factor (family 1)